MHLSNESLLVIILVGLIAGWLIAQRVDGLSVRGVRRLFRSSELCSLALSP